MTYDVPPPRRPIGAVRISTVALFGVMTAVAVPAAAAAIAVSGQVTDKVTNERATVAITPTGPITRVVVQDSVSDVTIVGDATATGATGQAEVHWKGAGQWRPRPSPRPALRQSVANGVLTLSKDCSSGACGPIDLDLRVPRGVSVLVTTTDGRIQVSNVEGGVDLTSTNGDLEAYGLGSGDASFTTGNGDVRAVFTGAPGRIAVRTTNGDVDLTTDGRTAYATSVSAPGGTYDLENQQDRNSADVLTASTTNGTVRVK